MQENFQDKKFYKADELANILGIKKFVIRTWESQFGLSRGTTQYSEEDLDIFVAIKELLYEKKLSPTAAKQKLPEVLSQKIKSKTQQLYETSNNEFIEMAQHFDNPDAGQSLVHDMSCENDNEVVGAIRSSDNIEGQLQSAFKRDDVFWNYLKNFKEQLLKFQEQLQ